MTKTRIYKPCRKCKGTGKSKLPLSGWGIVGVSAPRQSCKACAGTGRGPMKELREELDHGPRTDPDVLELFRRQTESIQRIDKWLSPPPLIVKANGAEQPVLPAWVQRAFVVMRTDGALLLFQGKLDVPDWTFDLQKCVRFERIEDAAENIAPCLKAGWEAAVVVLPEPSLETLNRVRRFKT